MDITPEPIDQTFKESSKKPSAAGRIRKWGNRLFWVGVISLVLFKLVLIRNLDIRADATGNDDYLYLKLADANYWDRAYDVRSLLRLPAYPLYVSLVQQLGLPLYLVTEAIAMACALLTALTLWRICSSPLVALLAFGLMMFYPLAPPVLQLVTPDALHASMFAMSVVLIVRSLLAASNASRVAYTIAAAFTLAVCFYSRSEQILIWLVIAAFALVTFGLRKFSGASLRKATAMSLTAILPAVLLIGTLNLLIRVANQRAFGTFALNELTDPSFTAAYKSLLMIDTGPSAPYVAVSAAARQQAYTVSPAFARLRESLEGNLGRRWSTNGNRFYHVSFPEIGGGWFLFAFRQAAGSAGFHADARTAAEYYQTIRREIQAGFRSGKIAKRHVWIPFTAPDTSIFSRLPQSSAGVVKSLFWPKPEMLQDVPTIRDRPRADFDRITNRRNLLPEPDLTWVRFVGFAFSADHPVIAMRVIPAKGRPDSIQEAFFAQYYRADAIAPNGKDHALKTDGEYGFRGKIRINGNPRTPWKAELRTDNGEVFVLSRQQLREGPLTLTSKASGSRLEIFIDEVNWDRTKGRALHKTQDQWESIARKYHRASWAGCALMPLALLLVLSRWSMIIRQNLVAVAFLALALCAFLPKLALLALIDASSFPGTAPRYLVSLAYVIYPAAIVLCWLGWISLKAWGEQFRNRVSAK